MAQNINENNSKKWKDALLRSSLPLENIVSQKIYAKEFTPLGEYSYLRKNEKGDEAEFSVDMSAFRILESKKKIRMDIHLLIECKYSFPGNNWVFSPLLEKDFQYTGTLNALEQLTPFYIKNHTPFQELEQKYQCCVKGIELHEDSTNPQVVKRAVNQLSYAIPNKLFQSILGQASESHDSDEKIDLLIPLLVTTANLRVLKSDLDLQSYISAEKLDDISTGVKGVLLQPASSRERTNYYKRMFQEKALLQTIEIKLNILKEIAKSKNIDELDKDYHVFRNTILGTAESIFVINLEHLDEFIDQIITASEAVLSKTIRIAKNVTAEKKEFAYAPTGK